MRCRAAVLGRGIGAWMGQGLGILSADAPKPGCTKHLLALNRAQNDFDCVEVRGPQRCRLQSGYSGI